MADRVVERIVESLGSLLPSIFPTIQRSERCVWWVARPSPITTLTKSRLSSATAVSAPMRKCIGPANVGAKRRRSWQKCEAQNLEFVFHAAKKSGLEGAPRPLGDFTGLGALVSTKVDGLPLQSIILKTALLPDLGGGDTKGLLELAARRAGQWLQQFHAATAQKPASLDTRIPLVRDGTAVP